ncbi:unnamed protein product [Closterium sp. NIES-53]
MSRGRGLSPTSLWTGSPGVGSAFRVWGCLALVRDTSADKLSARAIHCVFLGFPVDSSDYTFYHPPLHRLLESHDVRFDESMYPRRGLPVPPPPLFLTPTPPPAPAPSVPPPPPGPASSSVSHATPLSSVARQVTVDFGGVGAGGAAIGGTRSGGALLRGANAGGVDTGGASSRGVGAVGAGAVGATGGVDAGGACSGGAGAGGTGTGGASSKEAGAGSTTTAPPPPPQHTSPGGSLTGLGALGIPSAPPVHSQSPTAYGPTFPRPNPAPTIFSPPQSQSPPPILLHDWTSRCRPRACPSSPLDNLCTDLLRSSPRRAPPMSVLRPPPASSLTIFSHPINDYYHAARPVLSRVLASLVTDPRASPSSASALIATITDFASTRFLDFATRVFELEFLAATSPFLCAMLLSSEGDPNALDIPALRTYREAVSGSWASQWKAARPITDYYCDARPVVSRVLVALATRVVAAPPPRPLSVGGVSALGCDVLEDRQFELEFLAAASPSLCAMLLSLEGDPDVFDIPTPRTYCEVATWITTGVQAARGYELHSLDFSTAFLQGRLHEEIWLRRPPGFTGTLPPGTQWSLRRRVYSLLQSPCEWHDTLSSTLHNLWFHNSSVDPSLFVCSSSTSFFILVYIDDLVFATADMTALFEVKSELQKRHTCIDLGELQRYLGLQITRDRAAPTITLSQSHMVQQVLQRFRLQHSTTQPTPLAENHILTGPFPDEPFEPSDSYPELVGCLMYLMTCTRPDLAFPLSVLSHFVATGRHRPVPRTAAVRVEKYLETTSSMGLVLGGREPVVLTSHYDSSYADDVETQRSTQGYCFSLGDGAVLWRSTRSSSVATPSAEAEIYAGNSSCKSCSVAARRAWTLWPQRPTMRTSSPRPWRLVTTIVSMCS